MLKEYAFFIELLCNFVKKATGLTTTGLFLYFILFHWSTCLSVSTVVSWLLQQVLKPTNVIFSNFLFPPIFSGILSPLHIILESACPYIQTILFDLLLEMHKLYKST